MLKVNLIRHSLTMSYLERPAVVLDNGCGSVKAGLSGEDYPAVVFPPLIGKYRCNPGTTGTPLLPPWLGSNSSLVGSQAQQYKSVLSVKNVWEQGRIPQYEDLEQIWQCGFDLLDVNPEEHSVLLSGVETVRSKELCSEVMFETFLCPAVYVEHPAVLSLYGSGRCTGLVLLSGESSSLLYPVYEGFTISRAVSRHNVTGGVLTQFLQKLLQGNSDLSWSNKADLDLMRDMKERLCSLAMDYKQEIEVNPFTRSYRLPDGNLVRVGNERFLCPEAFFQPSLVGYEDPGIHQVANSSILACDLDIRRSLYSNMIMSGGSTLLPGFSDRLTKEMTGLTPGSVRLKVHNIPWRKYLVWTGGSIFASISSYRAAFVSKQEYEEHGPSVIHNRQRRVKWADSSAD